MNLASYQKWANHRILKAIHKMPSDNYFKDIKLPYGSVHATINHLIAAHHLWRYRLAKIGTLPVSLVHIFHTTFDDTTNAINILDDFWVNFLNKQTVVWYETHNTIEFQDGRLFTYANNQWLNHFWHHQSIIRGQLQTALEQQDIPCNQLDLIFYLMATDSKT